MEVHIKTAPYLWWNAISSEMWVRRARIDFRSSRNSLLNDIRKSLTNHVYTTLYTDCATIDFIVILCTHSIDFHTQTHTRSLWTRSETAIHSIKWIEWISIKQKKKLINSYIWNENINVNKNKA